MPEVVWSYMVVLSKEYLCVLPEWVYIDSINNLCTQAGCRYSETRLTAESGVSAVEIGAIHVHARLSILYARAIVREGRWSVTAVNRCHLQPIVMKRQ